MLEIRNRDFEGFFQAPFNAYSASEAYVSPMRSDLKRFLSASDNPLFTSDDDFTFFTGYRDGRPLGRLVVHHHAASNELYKTKRASFGFFDCADDRELGAALLQKAQDWARNRGFLELVGNFNLTAMQQCGVQTGGFKNSAYTDMVINPAHIPKLLEQNGFEPFFPMTTYELDLHAACKTNKALPADGNYSFARVMRKTFAERMDDARAVLNDGFSQNPMFVPLTKQEFLFQAGEMMSILDPRLSSVLHHNNDPVGVVICIPDLNGFIRATRSRYSLMTPIHFLRYRFNRKRAVIIFYSVVRDHHGRGIMGAMLDRTLAQLKSAGYEKLGITWIADENPASLRQMERLGAQPLHRLHLFRKALS